MMKPFTREEIGRLRLQETDLQTREERLLETIRVLHEMIDGERKLIKSEIQKRQEAEEVARNLREQLRLSDIDRIREAKGRATVQA